MAKTFVLRLRLNQNQHQDFVTHTAVDRIIGGRGHFWKKHTINLSLLAEQLAYI